MLHHHWRGTVPHADRLVWQDRRAAKHENNICAWSPLEGSAALADWVAMYGPVKTMIMFAGTTPGADLSLNRSLAEAAAEAALAIGCPRMLLASSSAVYGAGNGHPTPEDASLEPVNDYGRAKIEMEQACIPWREKGLEICCLRIGNVVGADALIRNVAAGGALKIDRFDDGTGPMRSYIGPVSLARVLATLAEHPASLPPILNLAAPRPVSMADLATAAGASFTMPPAPATALHRITLDCTALEQFVTFAPNESCVKTMISQWRELTKKDSKQA